MMDVTLAYTSGAISSSDESCSSLSKVPRALFVLLLSLQSLGQEGEGEVGWSREELCQIKPQSSAPD